MEFFKTKYGHFTDDGDFVITDVKTPTPWINVLTNGRYGAVYTQAGSGYSFFKDAARSMLTRWVQDLVSGGYRECFYIFDKNERELCSTTHQSVKHSGRYSARNWSITF